MTNSPLWTSKFKTAKKTAIKSKSNWPYFPIYPLGCCLLGVTSNTKWRKKSDVLNQEGQWLYFFQQAKDWDRLPNELDSPEMRQAMQVLIRFSEKEQAYHLYQTRQNALRDETAEESG